jgi:hypothetical protein
MYHLPHVINAVQTNKFRIHKAIIPEAQMLPERYFCAL